MNRKEEGERKRGREKGREREREKGIERQRSSDHPLYNLCPVSSIKLAAPWKYSSLSLITHTTTLAHMR